jgi:hypothetical protein
MESRRRVPLRPPTDGGDRLPLPSRYSEVLHPPLVSALEEAIWVSLDQALDDLVTLGRARDLAWDDLAFLSDLPRRYRDGYTPLFAKKFVTCLVVATHKMADPRVQPGILACVAEELAASMVLRKAEDVLVERSELSGVPNAPPDLGPAYDLLFEDLDFMRLYDPAANDVERDPAAETTLGLTNLAFDCWFEPFTDHYVHSICAYDAERRGRGAV